MREARRTRARSAGPPWSRERVIAELRRLRDAGMAITVAALTAAGHAPLVGAVYRYIGAFPQARRLAGIAPERHRERWNRKRAVAEIGRRHRAGLPLAHSRVPGPLREAAINHCGSWRAAIELAHLDYERVRLARAPWRDAEVIERLRESARDREIPRALVAA